MGDNRNLVDLSSFLLFEAAGDSSEAEFDPNTDYGHHHSGGDGVDAEDAESCCSNGETDNHQTHFIDAEAGRYDLYDTRLDDYYDGSRGHDHHRKKQVSNDDDGRKSWTRSRTVGEAESEGLFSQVYSTANSHCSKSRSRSRKCSIILSSSSKRSSKKKMNDKEKNKQFWENCLASSSFSKLCSKLFFH